MALYNMLGLLLSVLVGFLNVSTCIDWEIASGFNNIVPRSGNIKPYEPEFATYPLFAKDPAVPFDPEISW